MSVHFVSENYMWHPKVLLLLLPKMLQALIPKLLPLPANLLPSPAKLLPSPAKLLPSPAKLLPSPEKLLPPKLLLGRYGPQDKGMMVKSVVTIGGYKSENFTADQIQQISATLKQSGYQSKSKGEALRIMAISKIHAQSLF
jgi:hypothetical protein